jgi:Glycosyltransferase 61
MQENVSLESGLTISTELRLSGVAVPPTAPSRLAVRLKVTGHRVLNRIQQSAATLIRLFPWSWQALGLPSNRVRSLKNWIEQRRQGLEWLHRCKGPYYEALQGPIAVSRRRPRTVEGTDIHRAFTVERYHAHDEVFLARIPDAHILGPSGVVIAPDGGIVEESTWSWGWLERDRVLVSCKLPRAVRLEGIYYTIASLFSEGYAHWLLDVLPRLYALDRLPTDETRIVVSGPLNKWQRESLAIMGLDLARLVVLGSQHLQVDVLYFPSYFGGPGNPHPLACQWLRDRMLKQLEPRDSGRRLYISRRGARRRVINEHELEPILKDYGFEIIETELMSLQQQILLFGAADVIVGPHGAGMSNILWAPPDCKILELFGANCVRAMYYALADVLNQSYWYLIGDSAESPVDMHQDDGFYDMSVSPTSLAKSLAFILKS